MQKAAKLSDVDVSAYDAIFELETALTNQGAIFHGGKPWAPNSIGDGNLVTGQNPASAQGVAQKMIKLLEA
jgi:putative intracellular protease/amidase